MRIPISALSHQPWIVREKGSDTRKSMEEGLARHLPEMNVSMEIKSTETIKQAVIAGMGISFLSAHTVGADLHAKSLVVLDVQEMPVMNSWYLVHRRNKRLPPVAQAFRDFLLTDGARLLEQITMLDSKLLKGPRSG
jgi:DNA-binding transcriptional LysR family regulator